MNARRRLLVIDDEPTVLASCERIFTEHGYDVETTASGKEGLKRASRGYFDCALVDLKMPDLDGMEIVRSACENRSHMAILIITGYGTAKTAAQAARLGASDYICKPFAPEEIVEAVDRALEDFPRRQVSRSIDHLAREIKESSAKPEYYEHRSPQAVAQILTRGIGVKKATMSIRDTFVLGVLAGAYIGFGAALATLVGYDAADRVGVGIGQILVGAVFSVGLMLVVIAGAELFTGNNLMITGVLGKEYGMTRMLGRWGLVYSANFVGAMLLAVIMRQSGLWKMAANGVGAKALAIADAKVNLAFGEAFFRGVGCNWLVCLAVWMALCAKDIAGKVLAIFFPIMAFVALGYEHCVANMYFIPMGLLLKSTAAAGSVPASLEALTWGRFLTGNLLPVTLGNVVGGAIFVGLLYWRVYEVGPKKEGAAEGNLNRAADRRAPARSGRSKQER